MKYFTLTRQLRAVLTLLILAASWLPTMAYDFEYEGMYFTITSASKLEVEISHPSVDLSGKGGGSGTYIKSIYSGDFIIPETVNYNNRTYTVTSIGHSAFWSADITSIQIPSTITSIGYKAFELSKISSVVIPDNVVDVKYGAFQHCTNLQTVIVGNGVETIGNMVFYNCSSLVSVVLGKSVSTFEYAYTPFSGCDKLLEVFCLSPNCPKGFKQSSVRSNCEIYVPSKANYGFGIEYVSFGDSIFSYNGMPHKIEWENNLKAYTCTTEGDVMTEKDAGTYTKTIAFTYSNGVDFTLEIPFTYTINKGALTMTVNNAEREYGEVNPEFTSSISGFVEGETAQSLGITPTYSCEATKRSDADTYRILASIDAPNYDVTYKYGTLTVSKAPITMVMNDATRVYGDANPDLAFSYSGLKNNETAPVWTTKPTVSTKATAKSSVGTYDVTVSGGEAKNYKITSQKGGTLSVTPRDLTVKAVNCEKTYGEANPTFTLDYTGFVNGDTKSCISPKPTIKCDATITSNAGTYTIYVSGGSAKNYNLLYQTGKLTINPIVVGFKNTYNTVDYFDLSKNSGRILDFGYIPEITGDVDIDDFYVEYWAHDKEEKSSQYMTTIAGGAYAGKYVNYSGPTLAGKYIVNLRPKKENINISMGTTRCYLTVNQASMNLKWNDSSTITVEVGDTVKLDLSYFADIYSVINASFDDSKIMVLATNKQRELINEDPQWYVVGVQEGTTELSVGITNNNNGFGYYNFSNPNTLSRTIKVVASTGIDNATEDNVKIFASNGNIYIKNKPADAVCKVFSTSGVLMQSTKEDCIDGLQKGIYIIVVNGKSYKLSL